MDSWKWNLAFQCVFNIGVRGSENVRTRVVEADMVPIVATVLDNYIQAIEKLKKKADDEARRNSIKFGTDSFALGAARGASRSNRHQLHTRSERPRRTAPPPIEIPHSRERSMDELPQRSSLNAATQVPTPLVAPVSPTSSRRVQDRLLQRVRDDRQVSSPILGSQRQMTEQPVTPAPFSFHGVRPVRDIDRLPSMLITPNIELSSQPESPTTPSATAPTSPRSAAIGGRPLRRPSIRHQLSISGTWEDDQADDSVPETSDTAETSPEPMVGIQQDIVMQDIVDEESMLEGSATPVALTVPTVNVADHDAFIAPHRSAQESTANPTATPTQAQAGFVPAAPLPPVDIVNATPPTLPTYRSGLPFVSAPSPLLAALPRDEDVVMSLQLLAYVSKYCNLRSYFQQSHLVPRLKIDAELKMLDGDHDPSAPFAGPTQEELDEAWDNEFVEKPNEPAYNIFPLIEKFTVRSSGSRQSLLPTSPQQSETMQYWAGVVMRNLCRKDESRGGIRQCAYWKCGKWEAYTRQFAKCRRCRRTKYCSKECQKGAWGSHRFWCVAAEEGREGEHSRHHHGHSHHHTPHSHHPRREAEVVPNVGSSHHSRREVEGVPSVGRERSTSGV